VAIFGKAGSKAFFFEKKKQKTFTQKGLGSYNCEALNKSFLVLFFKKERLPFLDSFQR